MWSSGFSEASRSLVFTCDSWSQAERHCEAEKRTSSVRLDSSFIYPYSQISESRQGLTCVQRCVSILRKCLTELNEAVMKIVRDFTRSSERSDYDQVDPDPQAGGEALWKPQFPSHMI